MRTRHHEHVSTYMHGREPSFCSCARAFLTLSMPPVSMRLLPVLLQIWPQFVLSTPQNRRRETRGGRGGETGAGTHPESGVSSFARTILAIDPQARVRIVIASRQLYRRLPQPFFEHGRSAAAGIVLLLATPAPGLHVWPMDSPRGAAVCSAP